MKQKRSMIKPLLAILAVLVIAGILAIVYVNMKPKTVKGSKQIEITVIDQNSAQKSYQLRTDAENLRQALEETEGLTIDGTDSGYGLMVDTVNGVRANYSQDGAYWSFYLNDEYCNYGIEEQPVNDGDRFSIRYTKVQ